MREGGLDTPKRHPIPWQDPDFLDPAKLEAELRRVFDICHGCRRCFNLCDSFPRLFDLIDASPTGELDGVNSADFNRVQEACTLCDMCFLTKCPYVPPHAFNIDFPHLMLRARAVANRQHKPPLAERELAHTDRNGRMIAPIAGIANWASKRANVPVRKLMERFAGLHHDAELPPYASHPFSAARKAPVVNREAPAFGRKAVLYATCFVTYNDPGVGFAARAVLAHNGVETEVVYPRCCGMPLLEQGDIPAVAAAAQAVSRELAGWIERGYDIVIPVPSCALMLKFEWPLILPDVPAVAKLAAASYDLSEYVVDIAHKEGLVGGMRKIDGRIVAHIACHARAQNMGPKAAELLRLLPEVDLKVIERCSGHGGAWGFRTETFPVAMKVGRPVAREAKDATILTSECPLAGRHIAQGVEAQGGDKPAELLTHPIELIARAYGLNP
jgi:glycerol-3-phosphate dehydrogenase subunit C